MPYVRRTQSIYDERNKLADDLSQARAELAKVKEERDAAQAKLELLNQFYASDADENVNEALAKATEQLVKTQAELAALRVASSWRTREKGSVVRCVTQRAEQAEADLSEALELLECAPVGRPIGGPAFHTKYLSEKCPCWHCRAARLRERRGRQ